MLHMPLVFHAQFGQRAAPNHRDLVVHPRADQTAGQHERMHRTTTKALDINPGGELAMAHLGHGFGQVAAAPLIAVTNGFFTAIEDIGNGVRVNLLLREQGAHGHDRSGFTAQIFQQNIGSQRRVDVVGRVHQPDAAPGAEFKRQGLWRTVQLGGQLSCRHP